VDTSEQMTGEVARHIKNLVQFRAHRGLQGSHIGGHIVYFYNVSTGERECAVADVWEDGDEEMGPVWTRMWKSTARGESVRSQW
jgi:hypothetical protein